MGLGQCISDRWRGEGGYGELLKVAFPLIVSTGMWSLQHVIDRTFLSWYANEAVAASTNSGIASLAVLCLFTGTASYANTFVAQYMGAGRPGRVGRAVWQAAFFSLAAGVVLFVVSRFGSGVFSSVNHAPELARAESIYFRITLGGSVFLVLGTALSTFFSGREVTSTVMIVTAVAVAVNVILDYVWIFGHLGFPAMGITGAAWATVVSNAVYALAFFLLMVRPRHRVEFGTMSGFRFDADLFHRLLRFGLPTGVSYSLEVTVWAVFVLVIGSYSVAQSAANAVANNINTLIYMPLFGVAIAVSTLVGRYQGERRPQAAARAAWSGVHLAVVHTLVFSALVIVVPGAFIFIFSAKADPVAFRPVAELTATLLWFVAFEAVFDGLSIILQGALKGAGDTRFPMVAMISLSWGIVGVPSLMLYLLGVRNIYLNWALAAAYFVVLSMVMLGRFLGGKWRTMRVIEDHVPPPRLGPYTEAPLAEAE